MPMAVSEWDMRLSRYVNFVDLAVGAIVLVAIVLPAREMYASPAPKTDTFALGLAEAHAMARPSDGRAVDDLTRRLGAAGFKDWAIEAGIRGSARTQGSPDRWRALLATSVAYVDHLDVVQALDYANQALAACDGATACPSWEQIRMKLYQQHLDAGVKSGIDPHRGPAAIKAFRHAGESGLRQIHLGGRDVSPPVPSGAGSGAGSGSAHTSP